MWSIRGFIVLIPVCHTMVMNTSGGSGYFGGQGPGNPSDELGQAPPPTGPPLTEIPAGPSEDKSSSALLRNWWGLAAFGALLVGAFLLLQRSGDDECDGVRRISIGQSTRSSVAGSQIERFCFTVLGDGQFLEVVVDGNGDTEMELLWNMELLWKGIFYAYDDDTYGLNPPISGFFDPGVYIAEVNNYDFDPSRTDFTIAVRQ